MACPRNYLLQHYSKNRRRCCDMCDEQDATFVEDKIRVLTRVRPLLPHENDESGRNATSIIQLKPDDGKSLLVRGSYTCKFDRVFGPESTQSEVYRQVAACAEAIADGFNATIFAYGQTGSGKSHTMFGPPGHVQNLSHGADLDRDSGVIQRAIVDVFERVKASRQVNEDDAIQYRCSFLQIYNEQVFDMLSDPKRARPLDVHEHTRDGVFVSGLQQVRVQTVGDMLKLLRRGERARAVRETNMNQGSSRSHSIFQFTVERKLTAGAQFATRSKFNLVDLAGSEKWDINQFMGDERVAEMTNINRSLYTLGRCIAALSSANRIGENQSHLPIHIPYRDSKLTFRD